MPGIGLVIIILFMIPACLLVGLLLSFVFIPLIYIVRRKPCPIGWITRGVLSVITGIILFVSLCAMMIGQELMTAGNYWKDQGAYDFFRMPLEYPYELVMLDDINDAILQTWDNSGYKMLSEDIELVNFGNIWGIRHYYKQGNIVLGEFVPKLYDNSQQSWTSPPESWFVFDCNSGQAQTFKNKTSYLNKLKGLGFEEEPKLLSVRENWDNFWADESNWKHKKIPKK